MKKVLVFFSLSISYNSTSPERLGESGYPQDIQRGRFVNLNIDLNVHGVGGVDTWGQRTLPQYTIDGNKPYHYSFILTFFPFKI